MGCSERNYEYFEKHLVDAVWDIYESNLAIKTKKLDIEKLLNTAINQPVRKKILPTQVLVSMANRGELGINPFEAHRIGKDAIGVGADPTCLINAECFQISPFAAEKEETFNFNRELVQSSGGMLAPINGLETVESVGCGHFTAFVRAAIHGCRTSEPDLADKNGMVTVHSCNDKYFSDLCNNGWDWNEYDWRVAATWPFLPDLLQKALNASNSIATSVQGGRVPRFMQKHL